MSEERILYVATELRIEPIEEAREGAILLEHRVLHVQGDERVLEVLPT